MSAYDLDKLIEGKFHIQENIKALEAAVEAEKQKLKEYDRHIEDARKILEQHGVGDDGQPKA